MVDGKEGFKVARWVYFHRGLHTCSYNYVGLKTSNFSGFLSCRWVVSESRISTVLKYRHIMLYSVNPIRGSFLYLLFSFMQ